MYERYKEKFLEPHFRENYIWKFLDYLSFYIPNCTVYETPYVIL